MSSFFGEAIEMEELSTRMKVVLRLGEGEHSLFEIYLGERLGKKFILKTLKKSFKTDPVYNLMLRKEFEIGFSLSHPGIAKTLSLEEIEGLGMAVVEEYIPGKSMAALMQNGNLKDKNLTAITRELIETVSYLHDNQIVHNDLKPSNIIISEFDGKPKIIDFGFADSPGYTSMKFQGGTTEYIAPERLEGEQINDPRSDVWSLGRLVEKMATYAEGPERRRLMKFAASCLKPFEERERHVKTLLPILDDRTKFGGMKWMWILLFVAVLSVLFFLWRKSRDNRSVAETDNIAKIETPDVEEIETASESEIEMKEANSVEKSDSPKNSAIEEENKPIQAKETKEADEMDSDDKESIDLETAGLENEVNRMMAINYARRLTAEMIAERKEQGKFHQPTTREELLESRYVYDRLMDEIRRYVEGLDIPSKEIRKALIIDAQQAATDLIHEEAAKRDADKLNFNN